MQKFDEIMKARREAVSKVAETLSPEGRAFAEALCAPGGFADQAMTAYKVSVSLFGEGWKAEMAAREVVYLDILVREWENAGYRKTPIWPDIVPKMMLAEFRAVGWVKSLTDPGVPMMTIGCCRLLWRRFANVTS